MLKFLQENFRWVAGGFMLTYLSSFGQTFFISASAAEWQAAFNLSHGGFGRLYMMATLASALALPFVGKAVDAFPEHKVIAVVTPILAGAALLAAHAPSIMALTIAIFLLRLFGQGMMTHIALTATGRWFTAQRGRAVSLVVLGHQGGELTLPLLFAGLAISFGYQAGWIAGAVFLIFAGLPFALWAYGKPRIPHGQAVAEHSDVRNWTRGEVLRDPIFWLLLTGVLAPPFIGTVIFFHQDYLTALRGWPPHLFAASLSVMAATTILFALINGAVIDRFGSRAVLPYFLLPLAGACFVAGFGAGPAMLFGFMIFLGVSYGISSTLFGALWPEIYGTAHLGAVRSIIVSAMVFATAAGPGVTGTLIDQGMALPEQLKALGAYCLVASAVMGLVAMRLRRRFQGGAARV